MVVVAIRTRAVGWYGSSALTMERAVGVVSSGRQGPSGSSEVYHSRRVSMTEGFDLGCDEIGVGDS
jgi:hypothetical protein